MKKYISIIIFVIIYSSCFSQQNFPIAFRREISYQGERAFFNGSPFTGLLVDKNTNNKLGEFKDGYKNGVFTKYYTNGRKKSVGKYVNGIKEGAFTGWFENGVKQIVLNYVHGALDGIYTQWFNNGQIMVTYNYTQGEVKDGKYIIYNDTGQKAKQETYAGGAMISSDIFRNGALYKSILEKYPDGTKKEEGYTKDGLNAGLWTEWYENGQKSKEGKYEDGKKVGVWTWWYNNGGKKKEVLYEMGQEVKLIYENNLDPALSINAKRKPGSYVYRIIDGVDEDTAYVMVVMNFDVMTIQNVPNRKLTSFIHDLIASFTEFRFQKMSYSDISINEDKPLSYCIEFSKLKWGIKRTNSTKVKGQYWFTGAINLDMKISNLISDSVVFNETLESYHNIFYRSEERRVGKECRSRWSPYH